jgi:hypothetical protein
VPRSRDFLERFRPSGTPGAAAAAGVPADRVAERSAELGPVLAELDDTQEEARRIVAAARLEADRRRTEGAQRARSVLAAARSQAEAERAEAASLVRRQAEEEAAAVERAAVRDAEELGARTEARLPHYVERAVSLARERLAGVVAGGEEPS